MTKCAGCGTEISESHRFCPTCGVPVASDAFATRTVAVMPTPQRAPSPASRPGLRSSSSRSQYEGRFAPGALLAERFRIVALLGKGGMGEVYRADDLSLDQTVALKFLPEVLSHNPEAISRFRNEVRVARQVSHPNVCRVYDLTEIEGLYVLSMEYVDGEDLGSLLRRIGRLPVDKALEIARKLCAGLAAAHEKGVLHRDLKPSNIMLDSRGQVLLTDFGLAGIAGEIEGSEIRNGTPAYMAPEQLAGLEVTVKSDLYSLGLVLYEVFTGKLPFESETLAGLIRARAENVPPSPSTLVRELDPAVEKVILRCLQSKPSLRPASALSVAAALPGGDRLAAALAAGETPSPEMVAEAGEGQGLAPRVAVSLFAIIVLVVGACGWWVIRRSAVEKMQPPYPPEVLRQKARDTIKSFGYAEVPVDSAQGFEWYDAFIADVGHEKPKVQWNGILSGRPSPLRFWYRQAQSDLFSITFHDDWLTPALVNREDPPPIESGMIYLVLDERGRLMHFEAIPKQRMDDLKSPASAPDWTPLFAAAALDPSQLKPSDPRWNWLGSPDIKVAWTGTWPGTSRPLRVEAAALRGKPVAFMLTGSWDSPWREPGGGNTPAFLIALMFIVIAILAVGPWLARRNLTQGRADRRSATRLAVLMFTVHMAMWLTKGHFMASLATFGEFLLALSSSLFWAMVIWMLYLAIEPHVRKRWPQALISWTSALSGKIRDPIVGRDVLVGAALAASIALANVLLNWNAQKPSFFNLDPVNGFRGTLGMMFTQVPTGIRGAMIYLFLIFLMRVALRNQWLAGAAFSLLFGLVSFLQNGNNWIAGAATFAIYAIIALVTLRWGALAGCMGIFIGNVLESTPLTSHPDEWFFGDGMFVLVVLLALTAWGMRTSMGGRRVFQKDVFE